MNRFVTDEIDSGVSLAQAIILAEFGDVIVVHEESEKRLGEELARVRKPGTKIDFVVEPGVDLKKQTWTGWLLSFGTSLRRLAGRPAPE
jgi:hypothetical protein